MANSIKLLDGKYTFVINDQLQVEILRYGEPWRQFEVGDKAMWTLVTHAIELKKRVTNLEAALEYIQHKAEVHGDYTIIAGLCRSAREQP